MVRQVFLNARRAQLREVVRAMQAKLAKAFA
jgi:hypothetical protein